HLSHEHPPVPCRLRRTHQIAIRRASSERTRINATAAHSSRLNRHLQENRNGRLGAAKRWPPLWLPPTKSSRFPEVQTTKLDDEVGDPERAVGRPAFALRLVGAKVVRQVVIE